MTQSEKAENFRRLHRGAEILVLPNAWDCMSARIVEDSGFRAIATTSAGVAFSLGYRDGERISQDEMIAAVTRISRCVKVPVSADLEAGYSDVAGTARKLIEAGAIGLNIEDFQAGALIDIDKQVAKIHAIRDTGEKMGVPLFINARTDLYLEQHWRTGRSLFPRLRTAERFQGRGSGLRIHSRHFRSGPHPQFHRDAAASPECTRDA